jgi:tetratricopeptide (TPR) repeat protein
VPTQWNGALSTVLSKIRTLFVRSGLDGTKLLPSTGGSYELVLPSECWVDLEDAYRRLTVLAAAWHRLGDHQLAATIADTAITIDPLREVGYRILAEAEIARGDRGAAAQALRRCERMLREELQVAPSPEMVRLADVLRSSH